MILNALKKTIGVALIGLGIGILLVLLLPVTGWLFLIGVALACIGIMWLAYKNKKEKKEGIHMTIVVKKVPKFLRGFVKFIFRIKD